MNDVNDDAEFAHATLGWLDNLYRFAMSLTGDPADAADLVQETYVHAYRQWHGFECGGDARRWLFTICRRLRDETGKDAAAVVLVDCEDQTYEDAAIILGIPIGTVRSRLFRARRLLRHTYSTSTMIINLRSDVI